MLDRIYSEDDVTDSDAFLKAMEVRYKMKIAYGNEAAALNALKFACPRVFHQGRTTIISIQNESRLNLLPSHLANESSNAIIPLKFNSQCLRLQIRAMKIDELACKNIGLSQLMNVLNK